MDRDQKSLLLYLEAVETDYSGRLHDQRMNDVDAANLKAWSDTGYVSVGRVAASFHRPHETRWVRLSVQARRDAEVLRAERAKRMWKNRDWMTTEEYRNRKGA